jgi:predicted nucleic acid-binding protein
MIYVDTSCVLAEVLAERERPDRSLWDRSLVSSRLLEYEVWVRLHAYGWAEARGDYARRVLGLVTMVELSPEVLVRALSPFPGKVRTLDALHLATADYLRVHHGPITLATLDDRQREVAVAMHIPIEA